MTGTDMVVAVKPTIPGRQEIADLGLLATNLAKSGMFKDIDAASQAFAKLMFGRDLGLSATAAMTGVHLVEGKPEIGANIQAQMVKSYIGPEGERYDYLVLTEPDDDDKCEIEFSRRRDGQWKVIGRSKFTMADAEKAELTKPSRNGKPSNYVKFPRNMLFARAMSNGVAFHCPEVTNGIRTYHEGELDTQRITESAAVADITLDAPPEPIADADVVPEPEPELLSEGAMAVVLPALARALDALDGDQEPLRSFLITLGAADVPAVLAQRSDDGWRFYLATFQALSEGQAQLLVEWCGETVDKAAKP